jgi:DnaJ-class molecular chaperone
MKDCTECGGSGYKETSVPCIRCNGNGQIIDGAGNVIDCPAPGCFFGSIKVSACPKCNGTGKEA